MRIPNAARRSSVFLSPSTGEFKPIATGFLLAPWFSEGWTLYLATAKHAALDLEPPFLVRINTREGFRDVHIDGGEWSFHTDPNVDVAVIEFPPEEKVDHMSTPWNGTYLEALIVAAQ